MEPPQNLRADMLQAVEKSMGSTRGVKTRITTDESDLLDAGDGVEGIGADGLAVGSSSESGCVVVLVPGGTFVCCQKWSIKSMRLNIQEGQALIVNIPPAIHILTIIILQAYPEE
jgi:hypothetical protein